VNGEVVLVELGTVDEVRYRKVLKCYTSNACSVLFNKERQTGGGCNDDGVGWWYDTSSLTRRY